MTTKLLIATHNPGKAREYHDLLADLPLQITWLTAEGITFEAAEEGATFAENALAKARAYAQASGLLTWADDSGLEVDALGGWPGVDSARHAGPHASDWDRLQILLRRMTGLPYERRAAVFRCAVALATPTADLFVAEGSSAGVIAEQPQGQGGFGYDPIFYVPKFRRTFAQLTPAEKHAISHRGRAARRAHLLLQRYLQDL